MGPDGEEGWRSEPKDSKNVGHLESVVDSFRDNVLGVGVPGVPGGPK